MKQLFILLFAIPLLSFTPQTDPEQIVGTWGGKDKGKFGRIHFDKDGTAFFEIEGKKMGGSSFTFKGQECQMVYAIKTDGLPLKIDMIISNLETGEEITRLLCIAKFIDDNTLKFAASFDKIKERPSEFDKENSILLTREK